MLSIIPILAQGDPPDDFSWKVLTVIMSLLGMVLVVLNIVQAFRAKPPIHDRYETKEDARQREARLTMELENLEGLVHEEVRSRQQQVDELRREWLDTAKELFQRLEQYQASFAGIQRTLGNLEAKAESQK